MRAVTHVSELRSDQMRLTFLIIKGELKLDKKKIIVAINDC